MLAEHAHRAGRRCRPPRRLAQRAARRRSRRADGAAGHAPGAALVAPQRAVLQDDGVDARPSAARRASSSPAAPCRPQCRRPQAHSTQPSPGWRCRPAGPTVRPRSARGHVSRRSRRSRCPALTLAPTPAVSPVTVPARCATSGCSIFMASSTTTRSPSATSAPSSTATLTIVPCMGEASVVPSTPRALAARRGGGPGGRRRRAARGRPPTPRPGGQHDLEPLAADLDDDALGRRLLGGLVVARARGGRGRRAPRARRRTRSRSSGCARGTAASGRPGRTPRRRAPRGGTGRPSGCPRPRARAARGGPARRPGCAWRR